MHWIFPLASSKLILRSFVSSTSLQSGFGGPRSEQFVGETITFDIVPKGVPEILVKKCQKNKLNIPKKHKKFKIERTSKI